MRIDKWLGAVPSVSPYAVPKGAAVRQVNLQIQRPGELVPRPGMEAVYTAKDYDEIIGIYRVSSGGTAADALVVASKPTPSTTLIRYLTPAANGNENQWTVTTVHEAATSSTSSPTFCEDRHGRIYCFFGHGTPPIAIDRSASPATPVGIPAPTVAPSVVPTGNGYFIERVDVVNGGGSYWSPPRIVITGGSPTRPARLKTVIQGGAVVAVDVIDGGVGYTSPPILTIDETGVKGVGFLGFGVIGVDPGLQGFEPTILTTGTLVNASTTVTAVAAIASVRSGMSVRGTGIQSATTVQSVNVSSGSLTLDKAATQSISSAALTINGATVTGSTDVTLSHAYDTQSIAYRSGDATLGAAATFDPASQRWSALIPLTPAAGSSGSGGLARFEFTALADGLSYGLGGPADATWPVTPSGAFFGTSANTMLTPSNASPYTASDYRRDTDDNTAYQANNTGSFRGFVQQYKWGRNNHDFFAALAPNFLIRFHKRREYEARYRSVVNGVSQNPYSLYGDVYTYDFSRISLRYYTGPRDELETASDTPARWTWTTAAVQVSNGQPFIDVELVPALRTGTTAYRTYTGYQTPIVRIHLAYCPDSWLNTATTGDGGNACCLGWQRVDASGNPQLTSSTALGWWSAGQAENGVARRPIVDFRQGSAGAAGIAAGTVEILRTGTGMEQNTFFALQFDQVNAALLYLYAGSESQYLNSTGGVGNPYRHYQSNAAEYAVPWTSFDVNPVSPAFADEYYSTYNAARLSKTFTDYRVRFYFRTATPTPGQQGPPGPVFGEPTVLIPGSGFTTGQTATVRLRQRTNSTAPPDAAGVFADGQLYTFRAIQITPASATDRITSITVSSGGTSYYGVPQLVTSGGGGYGLKLDAVVANGAITKVTILESGAGFTSAPTITAAAQTAVVLPVLRPAMRGTYRCAYRFADLSQTAVATRLLTTAAGSAAATVSAPDGIRPGMVVESDSVPFMTRIVSIAGSTLSLSASATATATAPATIRDMTRPIAYSDFSPIVDVDTTLFTAVPNATAMQWSLAGVVAPGRATVVEFFRTSSDESLVFYRLEIWGRVQGGSVVIQGTDTLTDEELFDPDRPFYAAVPVVLPNGDLNAYRFGVPRSDMAVCAAYGDRLWYAVATAGEDANTIFFSEYDEFESCPALNELPIQNNQKTTDALTALVPFATYLLALQTSHCYAISFNTDPSVDATIQLVAYRGVLSQQCYDLFDNRLFAMDERGIYVMDRSGVVEPLSGAIGNYFDEGLLDLSIRERYFLKVDQRTGILRAFVALKDAGAASPHLALCHNIAERVWWTESWPTGLTCATDHRRTRAEADEPVYGCVDGDVYRAGGLVDFPYRSIQSVAVTAAGSGYTSPPTITASSPGCGARFTPILVDGRVVEILVAEPGFGYGTFAGSVFQPSVSLTIAGGGGSGATATATAIAPALADGTFPQTSVPFAIRTGALELVTDADRRSDLVDRGVTVVYRPTPSSKVLELREYFNNSDSPRGNAMRRDRGSGFVHETSGAKTTLDMAAARSVLGQSTGVAKAQFAGRSYSDLAGADRHVAIELSCPATPANPGDPAPSQSLLYALHVSGVLDGG